MRKVSSELSALLNQRFEGKFADLIRTQDRARFEEIVRGAGSTTCRKGKCKTLLTLQMSHHA